MSWLFPLTLCVSLHVNELLIRNESESHGGSLTERVEELLRGKHEDMYEYWMCQDCSS